MALEKYLPIRESDHIWEKNRREDSERVMVDVYFSWHSWLDMPSLLGIQT